MLKNKIFYNQINIKSLLQIETLLKYTATNKPIIIKSDFITSNQVNKTAYSIKGVPISNVKDILLPDGCLKRIHKNKEVIIKDNKIVKKNLQI